MDDSTVLVRLSKIEKEITEIKKYISRKDDQSFIMKLKGKLEEVKINEKDILMAKKSLFRAALD